LKVQQSADTLIGVLTFSLFLSLLSSVLTPLLSPCINSERVADRWSFVQFFLYIFFLKFWVCLYESREKPDSIPDERRCAIQYGNNNEGDQIVVAAPLFLPQQRALVRPLLRL